MSEIGELVKNVKELVSLLEANGNENWSSWFKEAVDKLENSDIRGCVRILEAYGGMGSFNDFYLIDPKSEAKRQELSDIIYNLVTKCLKDSD